MLARSGGAVLRGLGSSTHPHMPMTVHSIIAMSEALQLYLFACTLARTC
jgi:hypothetical protein